MKDLTGVNQFSIFNYQFFIDEVGWETGIRTPIGRSRDCSPTIRRSPSVSNNLRVETQVCQIFNPFTPCCYRCQTGKIEVYAKGR